MITQNSEFPSKYFFYNLEYVGNKSFMNSDNLQIDRLILNTKILSFVFMYSAKNDNFELGNFL